MGQDTYRRATAVEQGLSGGMASVGRKLLLSPDQRDGGPLGIRDHALRPFAMSRYTTRKTSLSNLGGRPMQTEENRGATSSWQMPLD